MIERSFYKMSGSGNDFVFFDVRGGDGFRDMETPELISDICARGAGVGADGAVFLYTPDRVDEADIGIRYYNSDGSTASLCGNATLCTASLATRLGAVDSDGFTILTGAGKVRARIQGGRPEFDLPEVTEIVPDYSGIEKASGELRLGFVTASIPHVVIRVDDVSSVDVVGRGRPVRYDKTLPFGANVNFVSARADGGWAIRTYERGVEDETLACGTGNVAAAIMLREWGDVKSDKVVLHTKSGKDLFVTLCRSAGGWLPSLSGEGRVVFRGELDTL